MKQDIKKFIVRSLLATLPVFLMVAFYAVRDPFHVIHPVIKDAGGNDSLATARNAGVMSVETFNLYNAREHYDSFIFGSSMSQNFKAEYWRPYLPADASILHFDASSETLDGIIDKMNYLTGKGATIKNALIIIEEELLRRDPQDDDILFARHPATTASCDGLRFHTLFFKAFLNLKQVKLALTAGEEADEETRDAIIGCVTPARIGKSNEIYFATTDSLIATSPQEFFTPQRLGKRKHVIYPTPIAPAIDSRVEKKLREMKRILDMNKSQYIIIIPPCNVKPQLMQQDLWTMKSIFGEKFVHDFSRHPQLIFNEMCYYDNVGHLISAKCKMLVDSAYREQKDYSMSNPFF